MSDLLPVQYDHGCAFIVDRDTGEVIAVTDAPNDVLAAAHKRLETLRDDIRDAKAIVDAELQGRMGNARGFDTGGHMVERNVKRQWDNDATWRALGDLVESGVITGDDADEAMPERTERKPDGRKLNALLVKLAGDDPEAAAPLARARSESVYLKVNATAVEGSVAE